MPLYLVSIHRPLGYDGATESAEMRAEIDALNADMVAHGIRRFVGGLMPPEAARAIDRESDGRLSITDGPYIETREFVGGFWVLDLPDMDAALYWGRRAATACRAGVEIRPFW